MLIESWLVHVDLIQFVMRFPICTHLWLCGTLEKFPLIFSTFLPANSYKTNASLIQHHSIAINPVR